ncbi:MAG: hypothetical protein ABJQ69_03560 [Ekhidna sp.]
MAEITIGRRKFFIPEKGSPCDLWRTYFTKLKSEVGAENAKMLWLITWDKNGSASCTTNAAFNKWLKRNEIDVSSAASRAVADVSAIGANILGLSKNMTKALSFGVPILLGGVTIVILMVLFNTAKKADLSDVAAITPIGRAAKLTGNLKRLGR